MASQPTFNVAIIGGGIGGLTTAISIHHFYTSLPRTSDIPKISITVYEQAVAYKEIGAGVGLGYNAAKLLYRLGIGERVDAISGDRGNAWIAFYRYDNGEEILTIDAPRDGRLKGLSLHRAELLDLLVVIIKEREAAVLETKKGCCGAKEVGNKMHIDFTDGTTVEADIVIGCDGIHSALRAQFITDNPRYSGIVAYRGLVEISKLESWWDFKSYSASWLGKDKHFLTFPISQNKILNVVAFESVAAEDLLDMKESWIATGHRADLEKRFEDFPEAVKTVIGHLPLNPSKWKLNDRIPLEQWTFANGKVWLMGDAAHAMLPFQGAGAGQAVEDGYIIGRALQDYLHSQGEKHDLNRWGKLYQDIRLPRAQKVARTSRIAGEVYEMKTDDLKEKMYEECIPLVGDHLKNRMKWIWGEEIDYAYGEAKDKVGLA